MLYYIQDRSMPLRMIRTGEDLEKAHVKAHFRLDPKTGRLIHIKDYDDARHKAEVHATFEAGQMVKINNPKSKHHGKEATVLHYSDKYDCVRTQIEGEKHTVDFAPHQFDHPGKKATPDELRKELEKLQEAVKSPDIRPGTESYAYDRIVKIKKQLGESEKKPAEKAPEKKDGPAAGEMVSLLREKLQQMKRRAPWDIPKDAEGKVRDLLSDPKLKGATREDMKTAFGIGPSATPENVKKLDGVLDKVFAEQPKTTDPVELEHLKKELENLQAEQKGGDPASGADAHIETTNKIAEVLGRIREIEGKAAPKAVKPIGPLSVGVIRKMLADNVTSFKSYSAKTKEFIFKRSYFYRMGMDTDKMSKQVMGHVTKLGLTPVLGSSEDHWHAWPKDSYYEVRLTIKELEDTKAPENASVEPKVAEKAPEKKDEKSAKGLTEPPEMAVFKLLRYVEIDLKKGIPDDKDRTRSIRALAESLAKKIGVDSSNIESKDGGLNFALRLNDHLSVVSSNPGYPTRRKLTFAVHLKNGKYGMDSSVKDLDVLHAYTDLDKYPVAAHRTKEMVKNWGSDVVAKPKPADNAYKAHQKV